MRVNLCKHYGFDSTQRRQERLDAVGLSPTHAVWASTLQRQIVEPAVDTILDKFYAHLWRNEPSRSFLQTKTRVARLKKTQREYLLSLGTRFSTDEYFESRLQIGQAHHRIGLPLSMYQTSYGVLQNILIETVFATISSAPDTCLALVEFIMKVTALDMSLAIEAYRLDEVGEWENRVESLRREREHLRLVAETDALTGAANRRSVLNFLTDVLQLFDIPLVSVIVADVDYFKDINDNYGHVVGDHVLCEIVGRCRSILRRRDVLGRLGGDELLVVLFETELSAALDAAERMRRVVCERPVTIGDTQVDVSITVGVAEYETGDSTMELIQRADQALYALKHQGRNRAGSDPAAGA